VSRTIALQSSPMVGNVTVVVADMSTCKLSCPPKTWGCETCFSNDLATFHGSYTGASALILSIPPSRDMLMMFAACLLQQQGAPYLRDECCLCPIALGKGVVGKRATFTEVAIRSTQACSLQGRQTAQKHWLTTTAVVWVCVVCVEGMCSHQQLHLQAASGFESF
jgi:hypothetical protein